MSDIENQPTELFLQADLPLSWQRLMTPLAEAVVLQTNENALAVLQAVLAWDDGNEKRDHDEHPLLAGELARMDTKLSLLLELVGDLLKLNGAMPPEVPVKLAAQSIEWLTDNAPAETGRIRLSIALLPGIPKTVDLLAVARSVTAEGKRFRVVADFTEVDPQVTQLIEKIIFRHHRRIVAKARRDRSGA